jgi:hypothetical protein
MTTPGSARTLGPALEPAPARPRPRAAEDVRFSHILGTVSGREAFHGVYRLAATVWRYKARLDWGG